MYMLVSCSNCHTPLQLPPGAESIRCALCHAVTLIADPRALPPPASSHAPPPPSSYSHEPSFHWPYTHAPPLPSPYSHAPPGPPPNAHGRKKAVICGISYKYSRHELKGCINDAKCMRYLLINKFHFPEDSIVMLTGMYFQSASHNINIAVCGHCEYGFFLCMCICSVLIDCKFLYLTFTRPNISFAVNYVAQFMSAPHSPHLVAAKRILCYLRGSLGSRLSFCWSHGPLTLRGFNTHPHPHPHTLHGFSNADWAGCLDTCRSTIGLCVS